MTEKVLVKAKELSKEIDMLRMKKQDLEEAKSLCCGNASDVLEREYRIEISGKKGASIVLRISNSAAELALDEDIKIIGKELKKLQREFDELH